MTTELKNKLQEKFRKACDDNSMAIIKQLLEKSNLKSHVDIYENEGQYIKEVFAKNNFELGDYLLSQPEIDTEKRCEVLNYSFGRACWKNNIELINTLYYDDKYKDSISLDYNSVWCFRTAYSNHNKEVLDFLILEANIEQTNDWVKREMYYINPGHPTMKTYCEKLFSFRKLNTTLPNIDSNNNKLKI